MELYNVSVINHYLVIAAHNMHIAKNSLNCKKGKQANVFGDNCSIMECKKF